MTLTRSQLHERISDLSGMYKAAQENKRLASQKRAEDERLADLSRQADEKADGHLLDVASQIREAQQEYSAAVEELIAVPAPAPESEWSFLPSGAPIDGPMVSKEESDKRLAEMPPQAAGLLYNSIFSEPADFQAKALENGLARIHDALDRAT